MVSMLFGRFGLLTTSRQDGCGPPTYLSSVALIIAATVTETIAPPVTFINLVIKANRADAIDVSFVALSATVFAN